jgi:hypothetical protein
LMSLLQLLARLLWRLQQRQPDSEAVGPVSLNKAKDFYLMVLFFLIYIFFASTQCKWLCFGRSATCGWHH